MKILLRVKFYPWSLSLVIPLQHEGSVDNSNRHLHKKAVDRERGAAVVDLCGDLVEEFIIVS